MTGRYSVLALVPSTFGSTDRSWHEMSEATMAARKAGRIVSAPVRSARPLVLPTTCSCGSVFTPSSIRQRHCSSRCRMREADRRYRAAHRTTRTKVTRYATCHQDRLHLAHGLCRACYNRGWKEAHGTRMASAGHS